MTATRHKDPRGIPWTVSGEATGPLFDVAVTRYLTFRADAMAGVDNLLDHDPECPMAWVLQGYLLLFARDDALRPTAKTALDRANALKPAALPHECQHIAALAAWLAGDSLTAQSIWDALLEDVPHDLLALRVQHFNALFLGKPDTLGRHAERTLRHWNDDLPGAGFAMSTACMGLEETSRFDKAERIGRRAAELEPDDLWALHSVAHVFEAEGRLDEGLDWMKRPSDLWKNRGSMRHHLWWHEALFLYEAGAFDRVLDYYDTSLETTEAFTYLEMSNLASLLYRLEAAGFSCGDRWDRLAERTATLIHSRSLIFSDVHALIVFSLAQDGAHLARLSGLIADHAHQGTTPNAQAAHAIGVPLSKAMIARASGDFGGALAELEAARPAFTQMGGSNAQRDVLDILLVDLAIEAGDTDLAKGAIQRYLDVRPHSVPMQSRLDALAQL